MSSSSSSSNNDSNSSNIWMLKVKKFCDLQQTFCQFWLLLPDKSSHFTSVSASVQHISLHVSLSIDNFSKLKLRSLQSSTFQVHSLIYLWVSSLIYLLINLERVITSICQIAWPQIQQFGSISEEWKNCSCESKLLFLITFLNNFSS